MSEKIQADGDAAAPDAKVAEPDAQVAEPDAQAAKPEAPVPSKESGESAGEAKKSLNIGTMVIGLAIVLSLAWYLAADRHTPYTSQARVQGYVVGVAPKVQGVVTEVFVENGQEVEANQPLFQIDRAQFEIALDKARSDLESVKRQVEAGTTAVRKAKFHTKAVT